MISSRQIPVNRPDSDTLVLARHSASEATRHGVTHVPATAMDGDNPLVLTESTLLSVMHMQCSVRDAMFENAVYEALLAPLPIATNDVSYSDQFTILALGPNRWYVLSSYQSSRETEAKLRQIQTNNTIAITDVSHAWNVIRLTGRHTRDVLAKLCSIDLHPSTFKVGSCAQTELRGLYVVLHSADVDTFEIFVMRSYFLSIWDWLRDAAAEYRFVTNKSFDAL